MKETDLSTTREDFENLHKLAAKVRSKTLNVTVPLVSLSRLLADHAKMWAHIERLER